MLIFAASVRAQCNASFIVSKNKICLADEAAFTYIGNTSGATFDWTFDDIFSGAANTDTARNPVHRFSQSGLFNVTLVVNTGSCTDTFSLEVRVLEQPKSAFTVKSPCLGAGTFFTSNPTVDTLDALLSYAWTFGDGGTSFDPNAFHTYLSKGVKTVTLKIVTLNNCKDSGGSSITIFDEVKLQKDLSVICDGGEVSFNTNTGSSTPSQYDWEFGDMSSGSVSDPIHQYNGTGKFYPKITVTYSNGGKCSASDSLLANPLPDPSFLLLSDSMQCFRGNEVCIKLRNSAQKLRLRSVVFDDGYVDNSSPASSGIVCHNYIDTVGSTYSISVSVMDSNFCSATYNDTNTVTIYPKLVAGFDHSAATGCFGTPISVTNKSNFTPPFITRFKWDYGDGTVDSTTWTNLFHKYIDDGQFALRLMLEDKNGCHDTAENSKQISNTQYIVDAHLDSSNGHCFSGNMFFYKQTPISGASIRWSFGDGDSAFNWNAVVSYHNVGAFRPFVRISKNGCDSIRVLDSAIIYGPVAKLGPIYNQFQCQIKDTVFLNNQTIAYRNGPLSVRWDANDPFSPNCVQDTKNNINAGLNCRYSVDSLQFRHMYVPGHEACYSPKMTVIDSSTGCSDFTTGFLSLLRPKASDGVSIGRADGCLGPEGSKRVVLSLKACGREKSWIIWDSTCAAQSGHFDSFWRAGESQHNYDYDQQPCDRDGWVTLGVVMQNGRDSFGNTCLDTAFYYHFLKFQHVDPRFKSNYDPNLHYCRNSTITFYADTLYKDSIVDMEWDWGDGTSDHNVSFAPRQHTFKTSGYYNVYLLLTLKNGCMAVDSQKVKIGTQNIFSVSDNEICLGETVQLSEHVRYWLSNQDWWADTTRGLTGREALTWDLGDGNGYSVTSPNPVVKYDRIGNFDIRVLVRDSVGCTDTSTIPIKVKVYGIDADFSIPADTLVCDQLVTFVSTATVYDSLHHFGHPDDNVSSYFWKFYPGNSFSNFQNPAKFLKAGVHTVSLVAKSKKNCSDSVTKTLVLIGPTAEFEFVGDSIGCQPFTARFTNKSRDANSFTWSFRDSLNTTFITNADTDVFFTYKGYGKFYPAITAKGRFNSNGFPVTCSAVFPDTMQPGFREITVYETPRPAFTYVTNCNTNTTTFTNKTQMKNGSIAGYHWEFGDGDTSSLRDPVHAYPDTGRYTVILKVVSAMGCEDTIHVQIVVAPFPVANFVAKEVCQGQTMFFSDSSYAYNDRIYKWLWTFGDSSTAVIKNPSKKYAADSTYTVTLTVTNLAQCTGFVSKTVKVHSNPAASFTFTNHCQSESVNLVDQSASRELPLSRRWLLGDGKKDTGARVNKHYDTAHDYNVTLIVTTPHGCADTTVNTVSAYAMPSAAFIISPKYQCYKNNKYKLTNTSTIDTGTLTYRWDLGNGQGSTQADTFASYPHEGTFHVTLVATTAHHCSDTTRDSLRVLPDPHAAFDINDSQQCYVGNMFRFADRSTLVRGKYTWNWYTGDFYNFYDSIVIHHYDDTGTYSVRLVVMSLDGCYDTIKKTVRVDPGPIVRYNINKDRQCFKNNQFNFSNSSVVPYGTNKYNWYFGDGDTSTTVNPSHSYSTFDTFTVRLVAENPTGCKDTLDKIVAVYPMPAASFSIDDSLQCEYGNSFKLANHTTIPYGNLNFTWKFGDGKASASKDISHSYDSFGNYMITMVATSDFGCVDSLQKPVEVYPGPLPAFSVNDEGQCVNGNAFVYKDLSKIRKGTYTIAWDLGDTTYSTLSQVDKTYSYAGNHIVKLVLSSNQNCKDSVSRAIRIFPKPYPGFSVNDAEQCERNNLFSFNNATRLAYGSFNTTWHFGDGDSAITKNSQHSYDTFGTYYVGMQVVSDSLCRDSSNTLVTVDAMPLPVMLVNDTAQCLNDQLFRFKDTSTIGLGSYTRLWTLGESDTSFAAAPSKTFADHGVFDIWLKLTSDKGCFDSVRRKVEVYPKPMPSFSIDDSTQCVNPNKFRFTSHSTIAYGSLFLTWNYSDGNSDSLADIFHTYATHGNYRVTLQALSAKGCIDSLSKPVEVYPKPEGNISANDSSGCENTNVFRFKAHVTIPYTNIKDLYWNLDGTYTSGSTDTFRHYPKDGSYQVGLVAVSEYLCRDTSYLNIRVFPKPKSVFSVNKPNQCENDNSFVFTNNSSVPYGTLSYHWDYGNRQTDTARSPIKTFTTYDSLVVTLIAHTDADCEDTSSLPIIVYPRPVPEYSLNDSTQCLNGNLLILTNTSTIPYGTFSQHWDFGDGYNSDAFDTIHTYSQNGEYQVALYLLSSEGCRDSLKKWVSVYPKPFPGFSINDGGQCLNKQDFRFSNSSTIASGSMNYLWRFGDGLTDTAANSTHQFAAYGDYVVELVAISGFACRDSVRLPLEVFARPFARFNVNDSDQCVNDQAFRFASVASIPQGNITKQDWAFTDGSTDAGINVPHYFDKPGFYNAALAVLSDSGCVDTARKLIRVYPKPHASFSVNDSAQCLVGNQYVFTQTAFDSLGMKAYDWDINHEAQKTTPVVNYAFNTSGYKTITLLVTSVANCKDTVKRDVYVKPMPDPAFNKLKEYYCQGEPDFTLLPVTPGGTFSGKNTAGLIYKSDILWKDTVKYIVTVNLCTDSSTQYTNVYPPPEVDLGNDTLLCKYEGVDKDASFWGSTYKWNTLNTEPSLRILKPGTYWVTVTNICGEASDTITVTYRDHNCHFYMPNAFSPDGNDINDYFNPALYDVDTMRLQIFNRWGEKIYEGGTGSKGWDGTYMGSPAQQDVYLWVVFYSFHAGDRKINLYEKGTFTLLR